MTVYLEQARSRLGEAARNGTRVTLISPPAAASWYGVSWWLAVTRQLRSEYPDLDFDVVLDCGHAPGLALEALAAGVSMVRISAEAETLRAVAAIATALGGKVV